MKKIIIAVILLTILSSSSLPPVELEFNQPLSHPLLSALRILSFYPFYGENDELCIYYQDSLQIIVSCMMDNKDYESLNMISYIIHEILNIRDYVFLKLVGDTVDNFITDSLLPPERSIKVNDIFFQPYDDEFSQKIERDLLCFS